MSCTVVEKYLYFLTCNLIGVPVDTPEVQHAKAAHFAAYAKAAAGLPVHAHTYAAGHYHVPVIVNGTTFFIVYK